MENRLCKEKQYLSSDFPNLYYKHNSNNSTHLSPSSFHRTPSDIKSNSSPNNNLRHFSSSNTTFSHVTDDRHLYELNHDHLNTRAMKNHRQHQQQCDDVSAFWGKKGSREIFQYDEEYDILDNSNNISGSSNKNKKNCSESYNNNHIDDENANNNAYRDIDFENGGPLSSNTKIIGTSIGQVDVLQQTSDQGHNDIRDSQGLVAFSSKSIVDTNPRSKSTHHYQNQGTITTDMALAKEFVPSYRVNNHVTFSDDVTIGRILLQMDEESRQQKNQEINFDAMEVSKPFFGNTSFDEDDNAWLHSAAVSALGVQSLDLDRYSDFRHTKSLPGTIFDQSSDSLTSNHTFSGMEPFSPDKDKIFSPELGIPIDNPLHMQKYKTAFASPNKTYEYASQTSANQAASLIKSLSSTVTPAILHKGIREELFDEMECLDLGPNAFARSRTGYSESLPHRGMDSSFVSRNIGNNLVHSQSTKLGSPSSFDLHPSRTIVISNLSPDLSLIELKVILEKFGPLRELAVPPSNSCFSVMAAYFDLRHAISAMRRLDQYISWKNRVSVRFAAPLEEATFIGIERNSLRNSDTDFNLGTLVVFNIHPGTTNDEIRKYFSTQGDVKEIRETPHKRHHKFVEFYDTRDAERALRVLNKSELNGKKIKIEISRPGGNRGNQCFTKKPIVSSRSLGHTDMYLAVNPPKPGEYNPTSIYKSPGLKNPKSPEFNGFINTGIVDGSSESSPLFSVSGGENYGSYGRSIDYSPMRRESTQSYTLDLSRVLDGSDTRTALMIRNIPNKYTQKMLLATLEVNLKGTFDFFYLPIDFKNKCNVGYAFINFINPRNIIFLYNEFHGKKWNKFNSEKVCEITYARIQGKNNLISHFQNSSLMNEDPKCRPLVFSSRGEPERFPVGTHVRTRRGPCMREREPVQLSK